MIRRLFPLVLCFFAATLHGAEDELDKLISESEGPAKPANAGASVTKSAVPTATNKTAPPAGGATNAKPGANLPAILTVEPPKSIPLAPPSPYPLVDLFAVDKNPGR